MLESLCIDFSVYGLHSNGDVFIRVVRNSI